MTSACQPGAPARDQDGSTSPPTRLRVATLNTHSFQEGADSLAKLDQIGAGLAALDVDLVGLNEVMSGTFWSYDYGGAVYDGTALIQAALERESGVTWYAARFGFAHWDTGEEMANAVLSRFPITAQEHRPLTTTDFWPAPDAQRDVGYARVAAPALGPVNLFVTHAWGWDSVDTAVQIDEVKGFMVEQQRGDEVLSLLLGDLNTPSSWPAYDTWLTGAPPELLDTYAVANPTGLVDPTTIDGEHRIDYILAAMQRVGGVAMSVASSHLAFDGLEHGGLTLPVVSDHFAVVSTFEAP